MIQEQENHDPQKILPLSDSEINSILKSQSESVFQDKNISNNKNFVKKSLIDIALDFESNKKAQIHEESLKTSQNKNSQEKNHITDDIQKKEDLDREEVKEKANSNDVQIEKNEGNELETDHISEGKVIGIDRNKESSQDETLKNEESLQNEKIKNVETQSQEKHDELGNEIKSDEFSEVDNETQQALDSVRDAVSQSMNKNENEITKSLEENDESTENILQTVTKDHYNFKNILSSLPTLLEEAIYEAIQNKILEISYELAGYQIDKMPEKYEKKIKSFLKKIKSIEDQITIEINDKDFIALSKIKDFNKKDGKKVFLPNKELSRGDIVFNYDGMHYSETSLNKT